jgi:hypothetical protein
VLTNSALVAFTGTWAIDYTYSARIWIFLAMTAGLLYVKFLVAEIVPDTPREVSALRVVVGVRCEEVLVRSVGCGGSCVRGYVVELGCKYTCTKPSTMNALCNPSPCSCLLHVFLIPFTCLGETTVVFH